MTSIAGCVLRQGSSGTPICEAMLRAQPRFGGRSNLDVFGTATFACSLSSRVPEDSFDRQPIKAERRYMLVADVRLDNRAELISRLGLTSSSVSQLADSDILMAAWRKWQRACLDHLIGDYAFALYDRRDDSLTLARDPVGRRPLFYSLTDDAWLFASMPSGLLASGRIAGDFNRAWFARMLLRFSDGSHDTWLRAVNRVMPAGLVRLSRGGVEASTYWQPPHDRLSLSNDEFVDAYEHVLEQAVGSQLRRSSGRLATHLSSGFDSSAVTAAAARLSPQSLPIAFTSAPRPGFNAPVQKSRLADESEIAAQTAAMYGLEHHIVRSSGHPLRLLERNALIYQEPDHNVINMDWWIRILRAARNRDAAVLLTGSMGNLTLHWGGLPVLSEWMRFSGLTRWHREARLAREKLGARWSGILYQTFGHHLSAGILAQLTHTFQKLPIHGTGTFIQPDWLRYWRKYAEEDRRSFATGDLNRLRLANIHAQDSATLNLGALHDTGIDERDPTADRRVLEFSFRLPPAQLLKDGISRPLMRRALARHLPRQVLFNPTRGIQTADWYEHLPAADINDILDEVKASVEVNSLIDLSAIRSAVRNWPVNDWETSTSFAIYRRSLTLALSVAVHIHQFEGLIRRQDYHLIFSP